MCEGQKQNRSVDLALDVAANHVANLYSEKYMDDLERGKELRDYYLRAGLSPKGAKRPLLRLKRAEVNRALVGTLVSLLPTEQQEYLRLKYKTKASADACALKLHTHKSSPYKWEARLRHHAKETLSLSLTKEDVLSRAIIVTMLEGCADLAKTAQELDSDGEIMSSEYVKELSVRHQKCRSILSLLELHLLKTKNPETDPICFLVKNPEASLSEIATKCNLSLTRVSRRINAFCDKAEKIIGGVKN